MSTNFDGEGRAESTLSFGAPSGIGELEVTPLALRPSCRAEQTSAIDGLRHLQEVFRNRNWEVSPPMWSSEDGLAFPRESALGANCRLASITEG